MCYCAIKIYGIARQPFSIGIGETGEILDRCPWLEKLPGERKYTCSIYFDRPGDCRYYPVDIAQMVSDDCEMLQPQDLKDFRQAQKKLDFLMSDSRPPLEGG